MLSQNRRQFLGTMIGGAAGLSASSAFARQSAAGITATRLGENFILFAGAGGNVLAVRAPEGDFRDWAGIDAWAAGIAHQLPLTKTAPIP